MFLYTIVPVECIVEQSPSRGEELQQLHNGADILEGRVVDGEFTVSRLISTDPRLYLDSRYAPGTVCRSELRQLWQ